MASKTIVLPNNSTFQGINTSLGSLANAADGIKTEVLWSNPSSSTTFAAQTVALSRAVADGEFCLIVHSGFSTLTTGSVTWVVGGREAHLYVQATGNTNRNGSRRVKISGNECVFLACTYNGSTANSNLIPLKIIGFSLHHAVSTKEAI